MRAGAGAGVWSAARTWRSSVRGEGIVAKASAAARVESDNPSQKSGSAWPQSAVIMYAYRAAIASEASAHVRGWRGSGRAISETRKAARRRSRDETSRDAGRAQRDELAFEVGERHHGKQAEQEPWASAAPAPHGVDVERPREAVANRRDGGRVGECDEWPFFARRDLDVRSGLQLRGDDGFASVLAAVANEDDEHATTSGRGRLGPTERA